MKNNSKLRLSELRQKANVITEPESLNAIRGGSEIKASHGDEAGTGGGGTGSGTVGGPTLLPVPKPSLP